MGRLVGIDYGLQRVGIAVTDPLHLIVTPFKTVKKGEILPFLKSYVPQEAVEAMVVGMPLHLNGTVCAMSSVVNQFILLLKRHFPKMPIFSFDERLTSVMAQASLLEGDFKKKARQNKAHIDVISATFILRSFLAQYKKGFTQEG